MTASRQDHIIVGIHLKDRLTRAADLQKLLSEYGCSIKTRLGLHDVGADHCSPNGLVLLELAGDPAAAKELIKKLRVFSGIDVQTMTFVHD